MPLIEQYLPDLPRVIHDPGEAVAPESIIDYRIRRTLQPYLEACGPAIIRWQIPIKKEIAVMELKFWLHKHCWWLVPGFFVMAVLFPAVSWA